MALSPCRSSSGYVLNGHCSCNRTSPDSPRSCVWVGLRPGPLATRRPTRAGVFPACWCRSRGLHPTTAYAARRAATLTPVSGYTDAWLAVGRCQWGPRVGGPVASPPVLPRRRWAARGVRSCRRRPAAGAAAVSPVDGGAVGGLRLGAGWCFKKLRRASSSPAALAGSVHFFSSPSLHPSTATCRCRLCTLLPTLWYRRWCVRFVLWMTYGAWRPYASLPHHCAAVERSQAMCTNPLCYYSVGPG